MLIRHKLLHTKNRISYRHIEHKLPSCENFKKKTYAPWFLFCRSHHKGRIIGSSGIEENTLYKNHRILKEEEK